MNVGFPHSGLGVHDFAIVHRVIPFLKQAFSTLGDVFRNEEEIFFATSTKSLLLNLSLLQFR